MNWSNCIQGEAQNLYQPYKCALRNGSLPGSPRLRNHKKLPIYIIEYHNDALRFILRNVGSRHLALENNTLIHFDSHPDLQIPLKVNGDLITDDILSVIDSLSIGDWILPAVYYGVFSKVIWYKMFWANQLPDGVFKIAVGASRQEGTLKVNFASRYFAAENCFEDDLNKLVNVKWFELIVKTFNFNDDLNWLTFSSEENYVLDIDLDFFSTNNPFETIYDKVNTYSMLKMIYKFDDVDYEQDLKKFGLKYKTQIDFLEKVFQNHLVIEDNCNEVLSVKQINLLKSLKSEIDKNYTNEIIDWELIHVAGTTCSDNEFESLPKYRSTRIEILQILDLFGKFLQKMQFMPKLITVCRSSLDDYTPIEDVDFIQEELIKVLSDKWSINEPVMYYVE